MDRRKALARLLAAGVVIPFRPVFAQSSPPRQARVAYLSASKEPDQFYRDISAKLGEQGWTEGKAVAYEWRFADGQLDQLPRLIQELIATRPDVIVVRGSSAARTAMQLTQKVPIVVAYALDPVGSGLAKSLPRPGGNVTGALWADPLVAGKIVELIREVVPGMRRLAVMFDANFPGMRPYIDADRAAAIALGIEFQEYGVRDAASIATALDSLKADRIGALKVAVAGVLGSGLRRIFEETGKHRIPVVSTLPFAAELGAVLTYSPPDGEIVGIAARQIDKVLRGAKPAEMPFEHATRMEVVVNVRAAKTLGLTVPRSTLLRADRVIE